MKIKYPMTDDRLPIIKNNKKFRQIIENIGTTFMLLLLLITLVCRTRSEWQKLRAGNFDIVKQETYRGRPEYIGQGAEYDSLTKKFRSAIEKNIDLLPAITKRFFPVKEELNYEFKFVAIDRERNYLILRYFARIPDHPLYAGYQIQFVFDINSNKLIAIFTSEVPLE